MDQVRLRVLKAALLAKIKRRLDGRNDPYLPLPEACKLSPSLGSRAAMAEAPRLLACDKRGEMSAVDWQTEARAKLVEITGYLGERDQPTVSHREPAQDIGEGLVMEKVYIRIRPETDLPLHLVYAQGLKGPAPVFLHLAGSTSGAHLCWGGIKVPIDHERLSRGADMAREAARRGYLGIGIEQAGFGERMERALPKRSANRTADLANHLLLLGRTLMGDGASDVSSAIDWLLNSEGPVTVDPARIHLFGHSAGGTLAQYAAALDTRISAVLASGSVGPIVETLGSRQSPGGDGIVPGFLNWFDSSDLAALVAPRTYIGLSGDRDHIFPASGVGAVVEGAKPIFKALGALEAIQVVSIPGPHGYYGSESWQAWERFIQ